MNTLYRSYGQWKKEVQTKFPGSTYRLLGGNIYADWNGVCVADFQINTKTGSVGLAEIKDNNCSHLWLYGNVIADNVHRRVRECQLCNKFEFIN